jgi:hypothetical protein
LFSKICKSQYEIKNNTVTKIKNRTYTEKAQKENEKPVKNKTKKNVLQYTNKILIKCDYSLLNDIINCKLNEDKFLFMINTHFINN